MFVTAALFEDDVQDNKKHVRVVDCAPQMTALFVWSI